MLVALPSAIAFGVAIFAPLGSAYAAQGAIAGILGTVALGFVAAALGGTRRLITAPSAPAAAVLSASTVEFTRQAVPPSTILVMMALVALACGLLQIAFGVIGLGRLIKYIPYPVVSGYLSGVGLIIIISQVPRFLGLPKDVHFWQSLASVARWNWTSVAVGAVTITVMAFAARVTRVIPAAILGLASGIGVYFVSAIFHPALLSLTGNPLVIGAVKSTGGTDFLATLFERWRAVASLSLEHVQALIYPALTLAVLLSIDTLKTSVVLDTLTRSRHDSNRELIGQGAGNLASVFIGGIPGSGQMGATLVNLSSGGTTRRSGMIEGALALLVFLALGRFIAWVPIAALAGVLLVVGYRMFDRNSFHLLRSRKTILDFVVIVVVIVVAESISLIAASGVGIGLAILLFIREQVGGSVVRRKTYGDRMFSKQVRLPEERAVLERRGGRTVIFELQGSLFFGTTDQLYTALDPELKTCDYLILDFTRVQSIDLTAAHMLEQIEDILADRDAFLLFSHLPRNVPTGQDMQEYFDQVGVVRRKHHAFTFGELDDALAWVENRILEAERVERALEQALDLHDISIFEGRKRETLAALESCMETRSYKAGEKIFSAGEQSDALYLIRRGTVRIVLPLNSGFHHLATFGRGDFFGEMAFLDHEPRSANAVADTDAELFLLSRRRFDSLAEEHRVLALKLLERLATVLAIRLRHANAELRALQET
jgi:SulP family sulfate permease